MHKKYKYLIQFIYTHLYTARLSASNCAWSISFAFDVDVFVVFDVISLAFSFCPPPVGDVSDVVDDDDAVTDAILFSCILP